MQIALRKGVAPDRRWHLRKDGSRVWIDGIMRRLDDEQGNLRGFAKIGRDATELHLAGRTAPEFPPRPRDAGWRSAPPSSPP